MLRGGGAFDQPETATDLRLRATQVRRLMGALTPQGDRDRLREFAEELEARAAEMEGGKDQKAYPVPLAKLSIAALRAKAQDCRRMASTASTEAVCMSLQRLARRLDALAEQRSGSAGH